jgi:hypothetical protein
MMRRIERTGGRYALLIAAALLAGLAVWLAGAHPVAPPALWAVRLPSQAATAGETAGGSAMVARLNKTAVDSHRGERQCGFALVEQVAVA